MDVCTTGSETNIRLDVSGSLSARPLCCFSFSSPCSLEPSPSSAWSWTGSADSWQGNGGSMSPIEGSLLGFKYHSGWNLCRDLYYLFTDFFFFLPVSLCFLHVWFVSFETHLMMRVGNRCCEAMRD